MGAFFTATSIKPSPAPDHHYQLDHSGRFIELRLKQGCPAEAVIDAGAVRFRPILPHGGRRGGRRGVILFDPIFRAWPSR